MARGSEESLFHDFVVQILHRELLEDAINSVPSDSAEQDIVQKMKKLASRTVARAVARTWKKAVDQVSPILLKVTTSPSEEISFDDNLREKFHFFSRTEDKVRVELTTALSSIVDPVLIDVATTFCAPLLASIVAPISQSFVEAINGFDKDIQKFIRENWHNTNDGDELLSELDCVHRRVNHLSGSFMPSRDILWDMYTTNCSNVLNSSSGGLDAYDLYCEVADSVRKLLHNAVHCFSVRVLESSVRSETTAEEVLAEVRVMMESGIIARSSCSSIINRVTIYVV